MNKNKSLFEKFKNSIYNIREIPNYILEGAGRAILYLLVLSLLVGGVQGIIASIRLGKSIDSTIEKLEDDKYKFSIENGTLSMETSPIKIEEGSTLVYIDDSKTLSETDNLKSITVHSDAYVLILKDGILISSDMVSGAGVDMGEIKYSDLNEGVVITNKNIVDTLSFSSKFIYLIVFIYSMFETFLVFIMDAILVTLMSMLMNVLLKLRLKFSQLFSLVIYTSTLPILLVLLLSIAIPNVYFDSVRVLGTFLYTFIVLRNMRSEIDDNMNIQ